MYTCYIFFLTYFFVFSFEIFVVWYFIIFSDILNYFPSYNLLYLCLFSSHILNVIVTAYIIYYLIVYIKCFLFRKNNLNLYNIYYIFWYCLDNVDIYILNCMYTY